ncbi:hypothetical protein CI807_01565 [Pseudomonas sp. NS1(2017)]|nr:hypothetical protein B5P22_05245 [Pseudomonas tolaasii]ASV34921.1 hypothetical protein CI807_01565 [Pseudomonas sp. NS1(2017)]KAB0470588.1 hypothetical protein F7R12_20325 [Pseudomonas tolaasii]
MLAEPAKITLNLLRRVRTQEFDDIEIDSSEGRTDRPRPLADHRFQIVSADPTDQNLMLYRNHP